MINQIDSTTIPELEAQLLTLTPIDKAEAIRILTLTGKVIRVYRSGLPSIS